MAGLTFEAIPMDLPLDALQRLLPAASGPLRASGRCTRLAGCKRVLPEGARGLAIIPTRFPEPEQESQR